MCGVMRARWLGGSIVAKLYLARNFSSVRVSDVDSWVLWATSSRVHQSFFSYSSSRIWSARNKL